MRESIENMFAESVMKNQGGVVSRTNKSRRCECCYKMIKANEDYVTWKSAACTLCMECIEMYILESNLLECIADKKIEYQKEDEELLRIMKKNTLGRLAGIVYCEPLIMEINYDDLCSKEGIISSKQESQELFSLLIKSANYPGTDFQCSLTRALAVVKLNEMLKHFPSLIEPMCKLASSVDKDCILGLLRALPMLSLEQDKKILLLSGIVAKGDAEIAQALKQNRDNLGVSDAVDLKREAWHLSFAQQLVEGFSEEVLKKLHAFIFKYVSGAGTSKKKLNLALDIVRTTIDKSEIKKLYAVLPAEIKSIINYMIWQRNSIKPEMIEEALGFPVVREEQISSWSRQQEIIILPEYQGLLWVVSLQDKRVGVLMDDWCASRFKLCLPMPARAVLTGEAELPNVDGSLTVQANPDFVMLLPNLLRMYLQQNISVKKNGEPSVAGCKSMRSYGGGYSEFFPDHKKLKNMRSEMLYKLIERSSFKELSDMTPAESITAILEKLLTPQEKISRGDYDDYFCNDELIPKLLPHLEWNFYSHIREFEKEYLDAINKLMRALPKEGWITVDQVMDYFHIHQIEMGSRYVIHYTSAIVESEWGTRFLKTLSPVTIEYFWKEPFIKTFFMLFATLGILDVAYTNPVSSGERHYGKKYLSTADGVFAVRMTALGEWYFLDGDDSCFKNIEAGRIVPDEKRLLLQLQGKDIVLQAALEQATTSVGSGFYSVDSGSFLKDCKSENAVMHKINAFKALLPAELPEVWQRFFEKTQARLNPLKIVDEPYVILRVEDSPELKKQLLSNPVLRKMIVLAEGGLILVPQKKIRILKNKLADLGFFVDSF